MSLLPSYTAPPSISWLAAYWADDPANRQHPNNSLVAVDSIKSLDANPRKTMFRTTGNPPNFLSYDPLMNGKASWAFDTSTDLIYSDAWADTTIKSTSYVLVTRTDSPWTAGNAFGLSGRGFFGADARNYNFVFGWGW